MRMRDWLLVLALLFASAAPARAWSGSAAPDGRSFGFGLQVGSPTALTAKVMLGPNQALDLGIGGAWGLYFDPAVGFSVHGDYLGEAVLASSRVLSLSAYVGLGAQVVVFGGYYHAVPLGFGFSYYAYEDATEVALLARVPVGLDFAFNPLPVEIYVEADPALVVFPFVGLGVGASLGVRLWL